MIAEKLLTEAEYFELEQRSPTRHEFVDGVMYAMAGDKKQNNKVVGKLYRLLAARAEEKGFDVFFTVVKMRVPNGKYRYPDVVVTCEENADEYLIEAPCAIFEVLSDSTQAVEEGEKLEEYLKIPSVERYVLLRQDKATVLVYARDEAGWRFSLLENTGEFDVPCLGLTLKLEEIYSGIVV